MRCIFFILLVFLSSSMVSADGKVGNLLQKLGEDLLEQGLNDLAGSKPGAPGSLDVTIDNGDVFLQVIPEPVPEPVPQPEEWVMTDRPLVRYKDDNGLVVASLRPESRPWLLRPWHIRQQLAEKSVTSAIVGVCGENMAHFISCDEMMQTISPVASQCASVALIDLDQEGVVPVDFLERTEAQPEGIRYLFFASDSEGTLSQVQPKSLEYEVVRDALGC